MDANNFMKLSLDLKFLYLIKFDLGLISMGGNPSTRKGFALLYLLTEVL